MFKKISEAVDFVRERLGETPEAGIVLGTGLGGLTEEIENAVVIPYEQIPHFPASTVEGHAGELIAGKLNHRNVIAMNGRFHFYEGYRLEEVVFPIRVMKFLGIRLLILSNASGGLNPEFAVGDMMFVQDHINLMNLMSENPLVGEHHPEFGSRFPDMNLPYDPLILRKAEEIASRLGINYRKGVYAGVTGPTFETPSEYKYVRYTGADAVGMSTVPEAIVAAQMKLPVFAISVISDLGVEGKIVEITHKEVIDAASLVAPEMTRLIKALLSEM
ncbi:MAG: purine-nucleoside phosphorylase [Bacteroidales bacterium]|nr:purine-nucleoside phosphorylase [Bacteroidales bacterium]